jgi:hypothetical protein
MPIQPTNALRLLNAVRTTEAQFIALAQTINECLADLPEPSEYSALTDLERDLARWRLRLNDYLDRFRRLWP